MKLIRPLASPRLVLDTLDPSDAAGPYADWMRDAEVLRFLEIRHRPPTAEDLERFIAASNASADVLLLGMRLPATGEHVGNIKLGPIDRPNRRAGIGLLIGKRALWGQGYASDAIALLSDYALTELGLEKLTAGCAAPNIGSLRAFLKAGFLEEGRLPSSLRVDDGRVDEIRLGRLA